MSKRKTKTAKRQKKAARKTNDKILNFFRKHSLGVVLLALLSALGGGLVWHGRDCLTDQKTQLTATRKAWTNARTIYRKRSDGASAFISRFELYKSQMWNDRDQESEKHHLAAMFELAKAVSADCNASMAALYGFDREMKALGRLFAFKPPDESDISKQCEPEAIFAESLRTISIEGVEYLRSDEYAAKMESLRAYVQSVDEKQHKANRNIESHLDKLEGRGIIRRLSCCF